VNTRHFHIKVQKTFLADPLASKDSSSFWCPYHSVSWPSRRHWWYSIKSWL